MSSNTSRSVSRRTALAGLGAGGLSLALATARPADAQDAASEMASHPVVGLWQFNGGFSPIPGAPDWAFHIFHADGTFVMWGGLNVGAALGLWRPTGGRAGEVMFIWRDTDPFPDGVEGPGTATFRFDLEVDEAGTTLTHSGGTIDARDSTGPRCSQRGRGTCCPRRASPSTSTR